MQHLWLPTAIHNLRAVALYTGSVLVACVHERKQKIAKRCAVPLCMAMLEECTMAHMNSLKEPYLKPCLPQAVPACSKVVAALRAHGFASAESALTGLTARVHGRSIVVVDVVLYKVAGRDDTRVGEVYFHALLGGDLLVCLSHWPTRGERRNTFEKLS